MNSRIFETIEPVVVAFPEYHPDAADINEALDHGVASCAVRAYASGLLLREVFSNEKLFNIQFGYSPEHGGEYRGENGVYVKMGHAVTRLWVPEKKPLIIESYNDSAIEVVHTNELHDDYVWGDLHYSYAKYLSIAGFDGVKLRPSEVLRCLKMKNSQQPSR